MNTKTDDPDAALAGICAPHLSIVNLTALIWSQIGSQSQRHLLQPNTHTYRMNTRSGTRSSSHLFNLDKILETSRLRGFNHFDALLIKKHLGLNLSSWWSGWRRECEVVLHFLHVSECDMWLWLFKYLCVSRQLTKERQLSLHGISAFCVFRDTLVRARVFLLEVRDFHDAAGFSHVHFAGERDSVHSAPAYGRYRTEVGWYKQKILVKSLFRG